MERGPGKRPPLIGTTRPSSLAVIIARDGTEIRALAKNDTAHPRQPSEKNPVQAKAHPNKATGEHVKTEFTPYTFLTRRETRIFSPGENLMASHPERKRIGYCKYSAKWRSHG